MPDPNQPRFEEGRVVANRLELPYSINTGGWSNLVIPYGTVANGDGPTVLLIAGNHGDEHEGEDQPGQPEVVSQPLHLVPPSSGVRPSCPSACRPSPCASTGAR